MSFFKALLQFVTSEKTRHHGKFTKHPVAGCKFNFIQQAFLNAWVFGHRNVLHPFFFGDDNWNFIASGKKNPSSWRSRRFSRKHPSWVRNSFPHWSQSWSSSHFRRGTSNSATGNPIPKWDKHGQTMDQQKALKQVLGWSKWRSKFLIFGVKSFTQFHYVNPTQEPFTITHLQRKVQTYCMFPKFRGGRKSNRQLTKPQLDVLLEGNLGEK